jgi:hypothetical protein
MDTDWKLFMQSVPVDFPPISVAPSTCSPNTEFGFDVIFLPQSITRETILLYENDSWVTSDSE